VWRVARSAGCGIGAPLDLSRSPGPSPVCHSGTVFVTNHVLSGVIIGQVLRGRPVAAFVVGVGSHLLLDACPHWGCATETPEGAARFLQVARRDGLLGLGTMAVAAVAVDQKSRMSTIAAMAGAALLDMDKPVLQFTGRRAFPEVVNRIHKVVQNEVPNGFRNELGYGTAFAVVGSVLARRARSTRTIGPGATAPLRAC
jgi:hypothetical protein